VKESFIESMNAAASKLVVIFKEPNAKEHSLVCCIPITTESTYIPNTPEAIPINKKYDTRNIQHADARYYTTYDTTYATDAKIQNYETSHSIDQSPFEMLNAVATVVPA
jgi:hypothetical protein